MVIRLILVTFFLGAAAFSQNMPKIEPGVSQELAKWRAVQYSNISYKLNLTLEKMSPVLKGTIEIHVTQAAYACAEPNCPPMAIILDWRKIPGYESSSDISNVTINGKAVAVTSLPAARFVTSIAGQEPLPPPRPEPYDKFLPQPGSSPTGSIGGIERLDHLIFRDGVVPGENVIKLDFTSPILTSGSAITRYIDKEDGAEYIYSLFVPSDASTAFPCFDQPDLKARFTLQLSVPEAWNVVTNERVSFFSHATPSTEKSDGS